MNNKIKEEVLKELSKKHSYIFNVVKFKGENQPSIKIIANSIANDAIDLTLQKAEKEINVLKLQRKTFENISANVIKKLKQERKAIVDKVEEIEKGILIHRRKCMGWRTSNPCIKCCYGSITFIIDKLKSEKRPERRR